MPATRPVLKGQTFRQWHLPVHDSDVPGGGGRGFRIALSPWARAAAFNQTASGLTRPARRLLALHDPARIVVVAEPPAPGSDGMDRRAPGWSWGSAVRRLGAVGQERGRSGMGACSSFSPRSRRPSPRYLRRCRILIPCRRGIIAVVVLTVVRLRRGQKPKCPDRRRHWPWRPGAAWVLAHVAKADTRPPPALRSDGRDGAAPAACARRELLPPATPPSPWRSSSRSYRS